ncbi:CRE_collapsed_G0038920.mRNA.1.CDS.1 [Saccharomyces cerevisiae]|nr:CRE_HP_G0058950.mRNA.1.CDS.1 [Saccharomyces cerevisiae]CAI4986535.1 CRE_HP_G0062570.mRNA.1.CDS.1 [Saccharomyces cerevisiae]CAI6818714.1 CRE_HP_G0058950.mRNA.1.CDS.1 [Saccharomyces cerevisiae]CAI6843251.1 CRE_HP_G0062570.mRNA.1.CDS.1 [Saccharomyces cerevisiae]CAI7400608.1 CRE_collapsed_G0038920.mRNA.1.CDS.1 [Saccharomyces cerevisiae]
MIPKLIVFGGNGFLGKRICQEAVTSGYQVVSVSRSGKAPHSNELNDKQWIQEVQWTAADIFKPDSYHELLNNATNVVHSLGILLENENYKQTLSKSPTYDSKSRLLSFGAGPNPLKKSSPYFTYEMMNKQSAIILADTFKQKILKKSKKEQEKANQRSFTYISADKGFPLIPSGYINSKREAEIELEKMQRYFRPIIVRPGFMFDEHRNAIGPRSFIHTALELLYCGNKFLLRNKLQLLNDLIRPTVSTQQVSKSVLKNIENPDFKGVVTLEEILKA